MVNTETSTRELIGTPRAVLNRLEGSIHDAAQAEKLGFRGSAVDGRYYLDVFAPLLVQLYGKQWYEHGALSIYYLNVVISGESVQAVVERPQTNGAQSRVFARRADDHGITVCHGTASIEDHSRSELSTIDLRLCSDEGLRMLNGVRPGKRLGQIDAVITQTDQDGQIDSGVINEAMEWHRERSPWGGPIATISSTTSLVFNMLAGGFGLFSDAIGEASGMNGAIEIAYMNGPIFLDRPYKIESNVVGVGQSPKTEYVWWDAFVRDENGLLVARMRHLQRLLKASSSLYPELQAMLPGGG